VAPTDTVETIDNIISELSEREQLVIHMRFEEGLFLDECAKRIGVTRGRAGEILKRAETRIKYKYDRLRLGDGKYGTIIGMQRRLEDDLEIKIKREIIEKLDCRIESLAALIKDAYNTINGAEEKQKESTSYVRLLRYTPLENLELSVRSYNCLKRAGYKCLNDFCDKTLTDIKKIRNIGRKSYEEIIEKLTEVGICLE
jgi:DNA-directed RNA polymerase sigma subunit (sigma70/sigma32)